MVKRAKRKTSSRKGCATPADTKPRAAAAPTAKGAVTSKVGAKSAAKGPIAKRSAAASKVAGSTTFAAFFKAHMKTGELADLYGSAWFSSALAAGELAMTATQFAGLDASQQRVLTGRFLLLALDPYSKDTSAALKKTWKVMQKVVDVKNEWGTTLHNPDFFLFNLHTGHAAAFGLSRKASAFLHAFDPAGKIFKTSVEDFLAKPSAFRSKLVEGDPAGVATFLLTQFARIGAGYAEFGPLPIFPEEAKSRLSRKKYGDYSKDELREYFETGTRAEAEIDEAEEHFRSIFKDCKVLSWEINPEDY
jgi:hypothetical protein